MEKSTLAKEMTGKSTITPIADDPLFALPDPGDAVAYMLPREGEPLSKCQDFYGVNGADRRYAVTDGVSTSFAPRAWASLLAKSVVATDPVWQDFDTFDAWLSVQGAAWHDWMTQRWVPTIHALQAQRGEPLADYTEQIAAKGAQATLICAALTPMIDTPEVRVELLAIGDAIAFHVAQQAGDWRMRLAFPLNAPEAFGVQPTTLATMAKPEWRQHAWQLRRTHTLTAQIGDRLLLASDTLAEWILHEPDTRIPMLLSIGDADAFSRLIDQSRQDGLMKDDDITLLIIPIHASNPPAQIAKDA